MGLFDPGIKAELYKLLIYDKGGFFAPHRDSEKVAGMFGTLIIVLPAHHKGGELIIRHAGREVSLALNNDETSEIRFAALYADCEHELKPVTEGFRICLVYNLLRPLHQPISYCPAFSHSDRSCSSDDPSLEFSHSARRGGV